METGKVLCWGQGTSGRLGRGADDPGTNAPFPEFVDETKINGLTPGTTAAAIYHENARGCAIMKNNSLLCWGQDNSGNLGTGPGDQTTGSPTQVSGFDGSADDKSVVAVGIGFQHSCAIVKNGRVACWGVGTNGRLGLGDQNLREVPTLISADFFDGSSNQADKKPVAISSGNSHTCVLVESGKVLCWGNGATGRLGDNNTAAHNQLTPACVTNIDGATPATTAISLSTGNNFSCALMANGTVKCWGARQNGRLGDGQTSGSVGVPVQTAGNILDGNSDERKAINLTSGNQHSCVVRADKQVACWGSGVNGKLGDANVMAHNVAQPTLIPNFVNAAVAQKVRLNPKTADE